MDESAFYTDADRARLYLVAAALQQELGPDVRVHCDLAPTQGLWRERDAYAAVWRKAPVAGSTSSAEIPILNTLREAAAFAAFLASFVSSSS